MQGYFKNWVMGLVAIATAQSCSLRERDVKYGVSFKMPASMISSQNRVVSSGSSVGRVAEPTSLASVQCFALNITGSGINPDARFGCQDAEMGIMAGTVSVSGGRVDAMVPAGAARRIQLIGVNSDLGYCPSFEEYFALKSAGAGELLSAPYLLGEAVTDVFGDVSITINPVFDSNLKLFESCGGGSSSSGGMTMRSRAINNEPSIQRGQCADVSIDLMNVQSSALSTIAVVPVATQRNGGSGEVTLYTDPNCSAVYSGGTALSAYSQSGVFSPWVPLYAKAALGSTVSLFDITPTTTATGWNLQSVTYSVVSNKLMISGQPSATPFMQVGEVCPSVTITARDLSSNSVVLGSGPMKIGVYNHTIGSTSAAQTEFYTDAASCQNAIAANRLASSGGSGAYREYSAPITAVATAMSLYFRSSVPEKISIGISVGAGFQPLGLSMDWLRMSAVTSVAVPNPGVALNGSNYTTAFSIARGSEYVTDVKVGGVPCSSFSVSSGVVNCYLPPQASPGVYPVELVSEVNGVSEVHQTGASVNYLNFNAGDGSAGNPYQIASVSQLQYLSGFASGNSSYFLIVANLDLSAWTTPPSNAYFPNTNFASLEGLTNTRLTKLARPLFQTCSAQVKNLLLSDLNVASSSPNVGALCGEMVSGLVDGIKIEKGTSSVVNGSLANGNVGALVGHQMSGSILNVEIGQTAGGEINVGSTAAGVALGGAIGRISGSITAAQSIAVRANIMGGSDNNVGGVVGVVESSASVRRLGFASGMITANAASSVGTVGGVVGQLFLGNVTQSYGVANLTAGAGWIAGGLIGDMRGGTVQYNLARVSMNATGSLPMYSGGLIGQMMLSSSAGVFDNYVEASSSIAASLSGGYAAGLIAKIMDNAQALNIVRNYSFAQTFTGNFKALVIGMTTGGGVVQNLYAPWSAPGATLLVTQGTVQIGQAGSSPYSNLTIYSTYGAQVSPESTPAWRMRSPSVVNDFNLSPTLWWTCAHPVLNHPCY